MSLIDLSSKVAEIRERVQVVGFDDAQLPAPFMDRFKEIIDSEQPSGYVDVVWANHSAKITTSTAKTIFLPHIVFRIASILAELIEPLDSHRDVFLEIFRSDRDIAKELSVEGIDRHREKIAEYFSANSLSDSQLDNFLNFVSDYSSWGGGKTIDRLDYYVSPLMKAGNLLAETSVSVAELAKIFSSHAELISEINLLPLIDTRDPSVIDLSSNAQLTVSKPFLLLAGISGTGKTRFVIKQAEFHDVHKANLCIVPVRPDWHEPSDLLGYVSRISGTASYVATDMLRFLVKAWQQVAPTANSNGLGNLDFSALPYWLCLDEMNLAPVEQYFSDYLSALETRSFNGAQYECNSLISSSLIQIGGESLRHELGLDNSKDLWNYFSTYGVAIPPNLIVAGTVNMDETTHGFSRKVIDRALTLDFGEFFPNDVSDFFAPRLNPVIFNYPQMSQVPSDHPVLAAGTNKVDTIAFFEALNGVLIRTPFELGFRALNELLMLVVCFNPRDKMELQSIWDDFLMMKVLPRVEGDESKLTRSEGGAESNLLESLENAIAYSLADIWNDPRKDFFRVSLDDNEMVEITCRSKLKLEWMRQRLEFSSFTSFWP